MDSDSTDVGQAGDPAFPTGTSREMVALSVQDYTLRSREFNTVQGPDFARTMESLEILKKN